MYDLKEYTTFNKPTVAQLILRLSRMPQDARVNICGDDNCYVHIETDGSVVNLDVEALEDNYEPKA